MRMPRVRLLGCFLLAVPSLAAAQVFVVSPGAGTASSYRNTTLRWMPMAGVTSYRLEVDDDPAFRSPEIDVVVDRPSYMLNDQALRLNGQLSWAAYVRVNGMRWERPAFSPSYFPAGFWPEVAVDSTGKVYYGYLGRVGERARAFMRTSDDFASVVRLSPLDTDGNPQDLAVEVNLSAVAHAFWTEQRLGTTVIPFHAKSPDWRPSQVGESISTLFDVGASMVLRDGRIDVFAEGFGAVHWFTSTDGRTFTTSAVPDSFFTVTAHATLDPPADILLVAERFPGQIVLQRSRSNWAPETIGTGRFPSAAVSADGVVHVVARDGGSGEVSYSNSSRAFATWTPLPIPPVVGQQLLPIVVDNERQRVYMAAPAFDGAQLCASTTAGDSWSCGTIGGTEGSHPDLTIDSSGVLHAAWADAHGGGYATSLGSFLAVNFPARARFAPPVPWPNTVIIDTSVSDRDGDQVRGSIAIGRSAHRRSTVAGSETFEVLGDSIANSGVDMFAVNSTLLFRTPGGEWHTRVTRADLASFPADIDVRTIDGRLVDRFTIEVWHELSATVDQVVFTALMSESFAGDALPTLNIQFVPAGPLTVRARVSDGESFRTVDTSFVRVDGQNTLSLMDFRPAADQLGVVLASIPPSHFTAPRLASVLRWQLDRVIVSLERALVVLDSSLRTQLLDGADTLLRSGILQRADGCAAAGTPDGDDWVIDCVDQEGLGTAGSRLVKAIHALR